MHGWCRRINRKPHVFSNGVPVAAGDKLGLEEGGDETDRGGAAPEELAGVVEIDTRL